MSEVNIKCFISYINLLCIFRASCYNRLQYAPENRYNQMVTEGKEVHFALNVFAVLLGLVVERTANIIITVKWRAHSIMCLIRDECVYVCM